MGAIGILSSFFIFLLMVGVIAAMVFYLITLMRAMNSLPHSERTMPGGLVFLTFVPYLGSIWLIGFISLLLPSYAKK